MSAGEWWGTAVVVVLWVLTVWSVAMHDRRQR